MPEGTILIADDDRDWVRALRTRLLSRGYNVLECPDGLSAISRSRQCAVDALVLDQEMPLGDGRTIAYNIRLHTDAPIIFLSGHARDEFRETVMRIPDTYYLSKPLDDAKLFDLLESLLAHRSPADASGPSRERCEAGAFVPGGARCDGVRISSR